MKFSASIAMAPPEQYIPVAREAEKLGYHAIVLPDSIFFSEEVSKPYPYTQDGTRMWDGETPWIEPLVGAAAMAGATQSIFFYTSVVKLPVRHPVLVAKQV
ncbi:MAG: LLM class flavin-dependent oxidoreductase, partial [Myxococcales bacterium]|nr:LLM class flavin-dependent oxidoreductase [Myxococcales bacterium]